MGNARNKGDFRPKKVKKHLTQPLHFVYYHLYCIGETNTQEKKTEGFGEMKNSELQILQVLWKKNEPMCASQIAEELPELKEITIRKGVQSMLKENVIRVDGVVQKTKNFARTFVPNIENERVYFDKITGSAHTDAFQFVCALVERNALSEEELATLKGIIEERTKGK